MTDAAARTQGPDVRRLAVMLFRACRKKRISVEEAIEGDRHAAELEPRDRALLASILLTAFRHLGEIEAVLRRLLDKPLPRKSGPAHDILILGLAQLLFLRMPPHAVIDLSVRAAKADRNALHFAGLVNAVLRKASGLGPRLLEGLDSARINTPDWLWRRWTKAYGADAAQRIGLAHAVIDLSVRAAKADRNALHFAGLVNAVLRKASGLGASLLEGLDAARLNTPDWLWRRWTKAYGADAAARIGLAHAERPGLDISVRDDPAGWHERLGGTLLPNGQLRLPPGHAPVPDLPGFEEGGWWVQDAAATIPVHLLGDLSGKRALDLCAAPGGKTLQMAAFGANVTAVDVSDTRLDLLRANLRRTGLAAQAVSMDMLSEALTGEWDAVLLDAPCSATGTIRRHPELPYLRQENLITELASLQRAMWRKAATLVAPGGRLVYSTCSLEPEEGEAQLRWFLGWDDRFELLAPSLDWLPPESIASGGSVRTLPYMALGEARGIDGFFAAVLRRKA